MIPDLGFIRLDAVTVLLLALVALRLGEGRVAARRRAARLLTSDVFRSRLSEGRAALTAIFTAPLVVAQRIHAQHCFLTDDSEVFGAGSKTVHYLIGERGVLAGPDGDLRIGLLQQSVMTRDGLHHEPVGLVAPAESGNGWVERRAEGWRPRVLGHDTVLTTEKEAA
jgi:hypothetical protein